jgi:hypothetical protein
MNEEHQKLVGTFWVDKSDPERTYKVTHVAWYPNPRDDASNPALLGDITIPLDVPTKTRMRMRYKDLLQYYVPAEEPVALFPSEAVPDAYPEPRKPIQIATGSVSYGPLNGTLVVFALANDGTVWRYYATSIEPEWKQIPALPQPEGGK